MNIRETIRSPHFWIGFGKGASKANFLGAAICAILAFVTTKPVWSVAFVILIGSAGLFRAMSKEEEHRLLLDKQKELEAMNTGNDQVELPEVDNVVPYRRP